MPNQSVFSGVNALNMENIQKNLKRADDYSLPQVLPSLLESNSEVHGGNVILILDNNIQLTTHICFLTSSPVLKQILMNIEVRLEKVSCISLPGYSEKSVRQLLHFLHKGFVGKNTNYTSELVSYFLHFQFLKTPRVKMIF